MYDPLSPCPACQRHVRVRESRCPFCREALPSTPSAGVIPSARARLSRAAVAAFATALASACTQSPGPATHAPAPTSGAAQNPPPHDAGAPDVAPQIAAPAGPDDHGSVFAEYGAPVAPLAPDAGVAPAPVDAGSPRRGARPPRRRPPDDWGNVQPLYGVAPDE